MIEKHSFMWNELIPLILLMMAIGFLLWVMVR
jgi:hypothetical protein